jgi:DNA-binding PadR family transcriptional regulator
MLIDKPIKRLAKLNTQECLWPYILKILSEKPMHAYILREEIKKRFDFLPGQVTSYTTLYSLKKQGLVSKQKKDRIVVYSITERGKKALQQAQMFYRETFRKLS